MESNSQLITVSEAAELLDTTEDRVTQLWAEGLIRRTERGGVILVRRSDVEEVLRDGLVGEIRSGELVKRLKFLENRVDRLESALDLLYQVNDLGSARFPSMTDDELSSLYSNVELELRQDDWPVSRMFSLCEMLMRLTEEEIDRLNNLRCVGDSWKVFLDLALRMSHFIRKRKDLDTDLDLQRLRDILVHARRNVKELAILFIEYEAQLTPSRNLMERLASADIEGFDDILRQLKVTRPLPN